MAGAVPGPTPELRERRGRVLRLARGGCSPAEICERMGLSRHHVGLDLKRLREAGLVGTFNRGVFKPGVDEVNCILDGVRSGDSYSVIARVLDVLPATVGSWVKRGREANDVRVIIALRDREKIRPEKVPEVEKVKPWWRLRPVSWTAWAGIRASAEGIDLISVSEKNRSWMRKNGYILEGKKPRYGGKKIPIFVKSDLSRRGKAVDRAPWVDELFEKFRKKTPATGNIPKAQL